MRDAAFSQEGAFWDKSRFGTFCIFIKCLKGIYYALVKRSRICFNGIRTIFNKTHLRINRWQAFFFSELIFLKSDLPPKTIQLSSVMYPLSQRFTIREERLITKEKSAQIRIRNSLNGDCHKTIISPIYSLKGPLIFPKRHWFSQKGPSTSLHPLLRWYIRPNIS